MNILSLFDGISCGQIALNKLHISYENYYASEVDRSAIKVTQHNFPNTIQLGDVTKVDSQSLPKIDLLMGGSPCTNFSVAGRQEGMVTKNGTHIASLDEYLSLKESGVEMKGQSYLFWEYVRLIKELKPKYFLLENVKMSKKYENLISDVIGVEPIKINSALVSAQNRIRLYWTNIPNITEPKDRNIRLKDILEYDVDDSYYLNDTELEKVRYYKGAKSIERIKDGFAYTYKEGGMNFPNDLNKKANCLLASGQPIARTSTYIGDDKGIRKITELEVERLQGVPENYTGILSKNKRYQVLGNGWNIDTIVHILKNIK